MARNKDHKLKYEKLFDDFCVRFSLVFKQEDRAYIFYDQAKEFLDNPDHFDRSILENKLELLVKDFKVEMTKKTGNKKNIWSKKTEKTFQNMLHVPFLKERADDFRDLFFKDDYRDLMEAQASKDIEAKSELESLKEKLKEVKDSLTLQGVDVEALKKAYHEAVKKEVEIKKGVSEMLIKIAALESQLNYK